MTHLHRWRLDEPHDGLLFVSGHCQSCGETRDNFATSEEGLDILWKMGNARSKRTGRNILLPNSTPYVGEELWLGRKKGMTR